MKTVHLLFVLFFFSKISSGQSISTAIGTGGVAGYSGDGGPANLCRLYEPGSICIDNEGNIFISDYGNNVIRKVASSGIITTFAGTGGEGYSGDGGQATNAQFKSPTGVATDDDGNIFIADHVNNVVRKISSSGIITTIAGTGVSGYSGDGGPAIAAKLSLPYAIVVDNSGNIIFSEIGNYIVRKVDASGIISTIAGNGTFGDSGEGGPATAAQLKYPGFMAIHPKTGELYIPVDANKKVMKVSHDGIITTVAGNGTYAYNGDGGPATAASMKAPNAVCFDTAGNLYIGDNYAYTIRKVNTSGIISTIAGTGTMGYNGDGLPATATQLNRPNCSFFDRWSNLYFADVGNNCIRRINYNPSAVESMDKLHAAIKLYPNPAKETITITTDAKAGHLTILNMLAEEVCRATVTGKETTVNIGHLPAGLYMIKTDQGYVGQFLKE